CERAALLLYCDEFCDRSFDLLFFFSSRRRHTRFSRDWSSDVCSSDLAVPVVLFLPESVKFLAQKDLHQHRIAAILRRAVPAAELPEGARFVVGTAGRARAPFRPADLFRGGRLALITPLVWLAYTCSSAIVFYLAFWGPILNERIGFSVSAAATLAAWTAVAGAAGQLLIGRFIDHRGAGTIAWMPLLAVPCLMLIGLVPLNAATYVAVIILAHVFVIGGHGGIISICGIFYRPAIRANGAGWATSVAKFGAMLGPWLAGFFMDHGVDARGTFFVFGFFPVAMVVLLVVLGRIQKGLPAGADGSLRAPEPAVR